MQCRNSESCPLHLDDAGTGRARLPRKSFVTLNLRLGSVVVLQIQPRGQGEAWQALCTAWPDPCEDAQLPQCAFVDASVLLLSSQPAHWQEGALSILRVFPPAPAPTVRIRIPSLTESSPPSSSALKQIGYSLQGLPVHPGFRVQACTSRARPAIEFSESNPVGVASVSSLFINQPQPLREEGGSDRSDRSEHTRTSLVDSLVSRLVDPLQSMCPTARTRGVLLYGAPGTGKTQAVYALQRLCADRCKVQVLSLSLPELLSMEADAAVRLVRRTFEQAQTPSLDPGLTTPCKPSARSTPSPAYMSRPSMPSPTTPFKFASPAAESKTATPARTPLIGPSELCVVLLDEVDALGPAHSTGPAQRAVKAFLCDWFDRGGDDGRHCCVVATSNRPSAIDPRLRRGGRLELELAVGAATASSRDDRTRLVEARLLSLLRLTGRDASEGAGVAEAVAGFTGGYSAADLAALHREVVTRLLAHTPSDRPTARLTSLYLEATRRVPPSSLRGATVQLPRLDMADVVGHAEAKRSLRRLLSFYDPAQRRLLDTFKLRSPGGALLHGPPGNSKTRLVLAAASSMRLPVIALSVADVYSPYVGDAEAEVRRAFALARQAAPCVLFLDEVDALVTDRAVEASSTGAESRVLATMLTEMDGLGASSGDGGILVLGATNRLDCIDAALLRKGRFHHLLEVRPPSGDEKRELLEYFCRKFQLAEASVARLLSKPAFQLDAVGEGELVSGADIENMCREEALDVLRTMIGSRGNA